MIGYSTVDTFVFSQLQPIIDDSLGAGNYDYLRLAAYAVVPLFIIRGLFNVIGTYALAWVSGQVVMTMRQQLFEKYTHLTVSFHANQPAGNLISKVTYDTEQVTQAAGKAAITLVREGALVVGLIAVMFYYSWQLSAIFLLIGPLVAVIVSQVSRRFRTVSRAIQKAMGDLTITVEQAVRGHKVILLQGGQAKESERFARTNNKNRQQRLKLVITQVASVATIQIIASIALALVLYIASYPQWVNELTPGVFTNVVVCMVMLLKPLKQLTTVNNEFQRGMAACISIFEVLDQKNELNEGTHEPARVAGSLRFERVSLRYPNAEQWAVCDLNLSIPAGQHVALVGRSGSGKSSLVGLLNRFYLPTEGRILLDEVDLNQYELSHLRKQFAVVSQQTILFNDTIANNISYGCSEYSKEAIEQAAESAYVNEFARQLPLGLDTTVGENGVSLSGGQRQRLAIARAILSDAPILIFDEATSALDNESERFIQHALRELQKNRTTITVAHRLSTIEHADLIVVMDDGSIVEMGSHHELMLRQGIYYQLRLMQSAGSAE